jgi:hypothetical protein
MGNGALQRLGVAFGMPTTGAVKPRLIVRPKPPLPACASSVAWLAMSAGALLSQLGRFTSKLTTLPTAHSGKRGSVLLMQRAVRMVQLRLPMSKSMSQTGSPS